MLEMLKQDEKRVTEHVYCLKDGKTGWQNLYIGKKIEKGGRRNMYTVLKMVKQDGRTCI